MQHERVPLLYEKVIEDIKVLLSTNGYKPGDRFPSERDLAERFHVSRVPVREAIKILEYLGVFEVVSGDGIYVKRLLDAQYLDTRNFPMTATENVLGNLFELRCILESSACYYAALRRTEEDLARLKEIVDQTFVLYSKLQKTTSPEDKESVLAQLRKSSHSFHSAVINMTHNSVLDNVYHSLFEVLEISKEITINHMTDSYDSAVTHEQIYNKIASRDADGARDQMLYHMEDAKKRMVAQES